VSDSCRHLMLGVALGHYGIGITTVGYMARRTKYRTGPVLLRSFLASKRLSKIDGQTLEATSTRRAHQGVRASRRGSRIGADIRRRAGRPGFGMPRAWISAFEMTRSGRECIELPEADPRGVFCESFQSLARHASFCSGSTCIHAYIRTYIHSYLHTHTYIHTYTHTLAHTHTHTHWHTQQFTHRERKRNAH